MPKDTEAQPSYFAQLRRAIERFRKQITIAAATAASIMVLLPEIFAGFNERLIAIPAAVIVIVMFDYFTTLEPKLTKFDQDLVRMDEYIQTSLGIREYPMFVDTLPFLRQTVSREEQLNIKIIAITGSTHIQDIVPPLCKASRSSLITIQLHILDPDVASNYAKAGIIGEELVCSLEEVKNKLENYLSSERPRLNVSIVFYTTLPCLHGILINDRFLVLGHFGWTKLDDRTARGRFSALDRPHRTYDGEDESNKYFLNIFNDWFYNAPKSGRTIDWPAEPSLVPRNVQQEAGLLDRFRRVFTERR